LGYCKRAAGLRKEELMQMIAWAIRFAATLALATLAASTMGQGAVSIKSTCQDVGAATRESTGDRDGHAIPVVQYSCRNEGGATEGSVTTGTIIWEWDKTAAAMVIGNGVLRKPGALAAYQNTEAKATQTVVDGKVTGIAGTSRGIYKSATGGMASLAGKSFSTTFHSIGGGQLVIETTLD
jgi:hypothetical protein